MDPLTATVVSAALTAGSTLYGAKAQATNMEAQADAEQRKAQIEGQWAERRALEERVTAQREAGVEQRKAQLAQSRLGAVAGASGSGAEDPTVMKLFEGIQGEGDINAAAATAAGDQRAAGITYQSALDRWTADTNARIKRAGAKSTLIGGFLGAAAGAGNQLTSRMALRYPTAGATARTGY